jgi:hypothetical protein
MDYCLALIGASYHVARKAGKWIADKARAIASPIRYRSGRSLTSTSSV